MSRLDVGKIVNVHGLRGVLKVQPWTDYPEMFEEIQTVYCNDRAYQIQSVSYQKNMVLLKLEGVQTVDDAEAFRNCVLSADRANLGALPQDTYYITDLIGCRILENNMEIGVLQDVIYTGGADLYEIRRLNAKPLYLPAVRENIISVDIATKQITVHIPEGLLEI